MNAGLSFPKQKKGFKLVKTIDKRIIKFIAAKQISAEYLKRAIKTLGFLALDELRRFFLSTQVYSRKMSGRYGFNYALINKFNFIFRIYISIFISVFLLSSYKAQSQTLQTSYVSPAQEEGAYSYPDGKPIFDQGYYLYPDGGRIHLQMGLIYPSGQWMQRDQEFYFANGQSILLRQAVVWPSGKLLMFNQKCYFESGQQMKRCPETVFFREEIQGYTFFTQFDLQKRVPIKRWFRVQTFGPQYEFEILSNGIIQKRKIQRSSFFFAAPN